MSAALIALPRAHGEARVGFRQRAGQTALQTLYQQGCCKVRFPRVDPDEPLQAVLLNTAGGMTDGDRVRQAITWQRGTHALVTSQAAERIYRSRGTMAKIVNRLDVAAGARAVWLPQETILFDGARLERDLRIHLEADATLFAAETWTLGRTAMGERMHDGALNEHWAVFRDNRLIWADRLHVDSARDGDLVEWAARRAALDGNIAMLTALVIAPEPERSLAAVHEVLDADAAVGAATQIGEVLLVRALASDASMLRTTLLGLFHRLKSTTPAHHPLQGCRVPRVFDC